MTESEKQALYRDARFTGKYDGIWQTTGKCVFCDLRDKYILLEENGMVLAVSLFAYIDGHLMIIPRRHVSAAKDLTQAEWDTVRKFSYLAKKMIKDVHHIKGMQVLLREGGVVAQSTVTEHLHIHCIPFDAPDLSQWNVRQLKHTPLENIALYKNAGKKLIDLDVRFEHKYKHQARLGVVCDLILINDRDEILFQERHGWAKLATDWITPPGGSVEDFSLSLEEELAREVIEETGAVIDPAKLQLVASRVENLKRRRHSAALNASYDYLDRFVWNTYVLRGFDTGTPLTAGDDARELIWVPRAEAPNHPRISDGVKAAIASIKP
jgi:diadenosine tetraphosphate (Ap4A) HIT family hydrolase/8-oxo-dGTP pyrophosphatase MutT (NUDIX family)